MPNPKVFISYSTRDEGSVELADSLLKELGPKYCVLLDTDQLQLGDNWRETLNVWTQVCDAAVVILSKEALESNYVRYEVSNLMHRRLVDATFGLFPVYLEGVDYEVVARSPLGPWKLQDVQSVTSDVTFDQTVAKLKGAIRKATDRPLDAVTSMLEGILPDLDPVALTRQAEDLGVELSGWIPKDQLRRALALKMLGAGLSKAAPTIDTMRGYIQIDRLRVVSDIVDLVGSAWVDPRSVSKIPATAKGGGSLGINGVDPTTARLFILRACDARRRPHDSWKVVEVTGTFGEDESAVPEAIETEVRAGLCQLFSCEPDDVLEELEYYASDLNQYTFVVLPARGINASIVEALHATFPFATFIYLTGSEAPDEATLRAAGLELLIPALEPGDETHYCGQYKRHKRRLIRDLNP